MNHEEFQRTTGADPAHLNEALRRHLAQCAECVQYYADLLRFEAHLRSALEISVLPHPPPARPNLEVWRYGLAAAVALLTIVPMALFVGFPRQALSRAVAQHVDEEPMAFVHTQPIGPAELERALEASHVALLPGGPTITYANHCELRGHSAFHFTVLAAHGPMVVMVLADDPVSSRQLFSEHGYDGELRPAPRGAIAMVGRHSEDFDAVAASVTARIRYLD
jgi:hypothetical protein